MSTLEEAKAIAPELTTGELIERALSEPDEDIGYQFIYELHKRTDRDSFEAALRLCRSGSTEERSLGACILAQLHADDFKQEWLEESVDELIQMLDGETHCDLLWSICTALGHRRHSRAIPHLTKLWDHPSADVRHSVAYGLLTHETPLALMTMIRLSEDVDEDVRNWATFGLAQQIDAETPEIRAALRARVNDEFEDVRGEALVGLAKRKEPGLVELILAELERDQIYGETFEAAAIIGDPCIVEPLERVREWWGTENDHQLTQAIEVCSGRARYED